MVNSDHDFDMELDLQLRQLQLDKQISLKNSLLDDNDLLIHNRSSFNTNKYSKTHSKSDGLPYHHNYELVNKYSGASFTDKSMSHLSSVPPWAPCARTHSQALHHITY